MSRLLAIALTIACMGAHAQKLHTISLSSETLSPSLKLNYRVVSVVDGRKNQSHIGVVQKGMSNAPRFATFKASIEQEIMGLLSRSQSAMTGPDVILRIEYLAISEQTRATSETGKVEITADLFSVYDQGAVFIARKFATKETRGMEVTARHPGNITAAFEDLLTSFNTSFPFTPAGDQPVIPVSEIAGYRNEPLAQMNAPILSANEYSNGIYATFEEFRDNRQSVKDGYEVREGDPLKARWVDEGGKKSRIRDDVYALAHNNRLYIFFTGSFYPIEQKSDGLFFSGPAVPDNGAVMAGGLMGGMIGGAIAAAASAKRTIYRIDLSSGSLQAMD